MVLKKKDSENSAWGENVADQGSQRVFLVGGVASGAKRKVEKVYQSGMVRLPSYQADRKS